MRRRFLQTLGLAVWAGLQVTTVWAEPAPGRFGFTFKIDADGLLNPVLKSVVITQLEPRLPAAQAGIAIGDAVVEIEGRAVVGGKARELEPLLRKRVGEPLAMALRRPGGELYRVVMTAVPKS